MQYAITTARPDIMIIKDGTVHLIDPTIPFNMMKAIKNARSRTREKTNYQLVLGDLDAG